MSPGSVILEKDPKVASFSGKFSSDPAPAGVEPADMLSFLTRASGARLAMAAELF